jgi:hypothetical protein
MGNEIQLPGVTFHPDGSRTEGVDDTPPTPSTQQGDHTIVLPGATFHPDGSWTEGGDDTPPAPQAEQGDHTIVLPGVTFHPDGTWTEGIDASDDDGMGDYPVDDGGDSGDAYV